MAGLTGFRWVSLRQSPVGGGLLAEGRHFPYDLFTSADAILLLIHGYAVHQIGAQTSYRDFEENLDLPWRGMAVATFWPGDSWDEGIGRLTPSLVSTLAAKMSYLYQPERARRSAKLLAKVLARGMSARREARRNAPLSLHIIAHSMGCRLTLELLDQLEFALAAGSPIEVPLTALMAPAVPNYMTEGPGVLTAALKAGGHLRIYHSPEDTVLKRWFVPGQALELSFPSGLRNRRALGLHGRSAEDGVSLFPTRLNHGEYWGSAEVARDFSDRMADIHPKLARPGMTVPREEPRRDFEGRDQGRRSLF